MPRKPAEQTVSRQAILDAAARIFCEQGYHGATMQDISAAVDLTPGSLYHHFEGGKDAILLAVLQAGLDRVAADVRCVAESSFPPAEKLHRAIRAHVLGVTEQGAVAALMILEMRATLGLPDVPAEFLARRDQVESLYRQMIVEGITAGAFRPVDVGVFAHTLLGASNWVSVWYRPGGRLKGADIAEEIADLFLNALRAR